MLGRATSICQTLSYSASYGIVKPNLWRKNNPGTTVGLVQKLRLTILYDFIRMAIILIFYKNTLNSDLLVIVVVIHLSLFAFSMVQSPANWSRPACHPCQWRSVNRYCCEYYYQGAKWNIVPWLGVGITHLTSLTITLRLRIWGGNVVLGLEKLQSLNMNCKY